MDMMLKKGSRGELVKQLQRALNLIPDGVFGALTEEAVKAFQKSKGLKQDGIVGDKTWAMLPKPDYGVGGILKQSKRNIKEIIVHCTATPEGRAETVESIRNMHKSQGWSDIGYHYLVYLDGSIHVGRDVNIVGSHCVGHNTYSIGVCYVGGVDKKLQPKDTRTQAQKKALLDVLKKLKTMYPKAKIVGHRDYSSKACPSFDATKEYKNL
jgi:N-acetylmuramoyl-L-alanine amidase